MAEEKEEKKIEILGKTFHIQNTFPKINKDWLWCLKTETSVEESNLDGTEKTTYVVKIEHHDQDIYITKKNEDKLWSWMWKSKNPNDLNVCGYGGSWPFRMVPYKEKTLE